MESLSDKRIIHRDLKPDNILLDESKKLYFIDFGLSVKEDPTKLFSRAGTPGFLAPELLEKGQRVTDRYNSQTDIFSMGVIHYCMVTGEHPFDAEDADGVLLNN